MKRFVLDGEAFDDDESFYRHVQEVLCPRFTWGRNLNAFNDLLWGGFEVFGYEEKIELVWRNIAKARETLGPELFDAYLEIIRDHPNVTFKLEDP